MGRRVVARREQETYLVETYLVEAKSIKRRVVVGTPEAGFLKTKEIWGQAGKVRVEGSKRGTKGVWSRGPGPQIGTKDDKGGANVGPVRSLLIRTNVKKGKLPLPTCGTDAQTMFNTQIVKIAGGSVESGACICMGLNSGWHEIQCEIDSMLYHCGDIGAARCFSDILCCYSWTLGLVFFVLPRRCNFILPIVFHSHMFLFHIPPATLYIPVRYLNNRSLYPHTLSGIGYRWKQCRSLQGLG
jgi:hypothetical protein